MILTESKEKEAYKEWLFGESPMVVCKNYGITYAKLLAIIEKWNRKYEEQLQSLNTNNVDVYARVVYPVYTSSSSMHYRTEEVDAYHFELLKAKYEERLEVLYKR